MWEKGRDDCGVLNAMAARVGIDLQLLQVIYARSDVVSQSAMPAERRREDFTIMFHLLGS